MPKISVILPVYNGERYLRSAIDSILQQTYPDFELLIINDGSADDSEAIIASYTDKRITHINNKTNKGLVYSLNKGIELSQGKYIARMDADDIMVPERLQTQFEYLEANPNYDVIASTIVLINSQDEAIGKWEIDAMVHDRESIRKKMPRENCIAHPTVFGKKSIFERFRYNPLQKNIEDYDLWLRMLNAGVQITKIRKPLVLYRIHSSSITQDTKSKTLPTLRVFQCKKVYLVNEIRNFRVSWFTMNVFLYMLIDGITVFKKRFFSIAL